MHAQMRACHASRPAWSFLTHAATKGVPRRPLNRHVRTCACTQALESAREHNATIKDDIWHELAKAKFAQWERDSAARKDQRRALRQQLDRWLAAGAGRGDRGSATVGPLLRLWLWPGRGSTANGLSCRRMLRACSTYLACAGTLVGPVQAPSHMQMGGPQVLRFLCACPRADEQVAGSQRGAWDALFTAGSRHDVPSEVPSVYTCPLTMEVGAGATSRHSHMPLLCAFQEAFSPSPSAQRTYPSSSFRPELLDYALSNPTQTNRNNRCFVSPSSPQQATATSAVPCSNTYARCAVALDW